jgi:hypothetical protein
MSSVAVTWGSTAVERAMAFPCDGRFAGGAALFRAVSVRAPPAGVFRWLCQLRAAPYSYDWIDNGGRRSPRTLTPGLEQLARGQRVMRIFELTDFEPDRHLTLVLVDPGGVRLFGEIAITYLVVPDGGGARIVVKVLLPSPATFFGRVRAALLAWGDLVMMRKQLLTLKALAEASAPGP